MMIIDDGGEPEKDILNDAACTPPVCASVHANLLSADQDCDDFPAQAAAVVSLHC